MIRRLATTLAAVAVLLGTSAGTIFAATMNYLGAWANTNTYATGSVVVYNKGIYYSLKSSNSAPNKGYIPNSSPTWWEQVGTVGNTILSGVGNPTSQGLGQVGDYYVNTQTSTLFGPKTSISPYWPANGVSLIGPKGDVGAAGPAGPSGPAGATGPAGPQGIAGLKGDTGNTGPQGAKGDAGAQGVKGDQGPLAPGQTLVDGNGNVVATGGLMQFDGQFVGVPINSRFGFALTPMPVIEKRYYLTTDCSGTPYRLATEGFIQTAYAYSATAETVLSDDGRGQRRYNSSAALYFAGEPTEEKVIGSIRSRDSDGLLNCNLATIYSSNTRYFVGPEKTKEVSLTLPISVR